MKVYRIQDKDGRGPFKPGFSKRWLDPEPKPNEELLVPWPYQFPDILFRIQVEGTINFGCACASPEQLQMWFSESEYNRLKRFGYKSVTLEIDEILGQSDIQLVFRRLKPIKVDAMPFALYGGLIEH